jgi:hypothetical protein
MLPGMAEKNRVANAAEANSRTVFLILPLPLPYLSLVRRRRKEGEPPALFSELWLTAATLHMEQIPYVIGVTIAGMEAWCIW